MTLAELLIALAITGVLMAAVTTMTFALDSANNKANLTGQSQGRIRYATLKVSELIKHCRLICAYYNNELIIWKSDDDGDDKIDLEELLFINFGSNDCIKLKTYSNIPSEYINIDIHPNYFTNGDAQTALEQSCTKSEVNVVPQCENLQVRFDQPGLPAWQRKFVSILFDVTENQETRRYQVNAKLSVCAENLVSSDGTIVADDD